MCLIALSIGLAPLSPLSFAKVSLVFSCKPPKVSYFQNFLLTRLDFCGNLSQQLNITYFLHIRSDPAGLNILAFSRYITD